MPIKFFKYQGTGNDFIMIDNRDNSFQKSTELISHLCHRRFGIGADGLIMLENQEGYDFKMVYYNADGNEGSMCGNGGRCIVKFAADLGIFKIDTHFIAVDGEHFASVNGDNIKLKMSDVEKIEFIENDSFLNTGSPHLIKNVEDIDEVNVKAEGSTIRFSQEWAEKGGVNVNFVEQLENNTIFVRTYERGVEDETYSCGTGVTAAAIHSVVRNGMSSPVYINTIGGNLSVEFSKNNVLFEDIYLSGPAIFVFSGNFK